jgi:hypothetical protein
VNRSILATTLTALSFSSLLVFVMPSCTTEAYCFKCDPNFTPGAEGGEDGNGNSGGTSNVNVSGGSGGSLSVAGEGNLPLGGNSGECDADLENDPANCGECGRVCSLFGAFSECVAGRCVIDECAAGYRDLNGKASDGCEYKCPVYPEMEEECNGLDDDCDGEKDEDFDLTTIDDCGSCGNQCLLSNATAGCQKVNGHHQCVVVECEPGFFDVDKVSANGCEYACEGDPDDPNDGKPGDPEVCDGFDNDCDGLVDEDIEEIPCANNFPCPNGICAGECQAGVAVCVGTGYVCVGGIGPEPEICDGLDNDCDGTPNPNDPTNSDPAHIDEDFDTQTDPLNCGACGNRCDLPNAISHCVAGKCEILQCKPGFGDLDDDVPGCEHECDTDFISVEVCDGIDNDCDGLVDEGVSAPPGFCTQTGPCAGATATCVNGAWVCNYKSRDPRIELQPNGSLAYEETLCDGFDNDCDGQIDEVYPDKNKTCTSPGNGICVTTSTYQCKADGSGLECPATTSNSSAKPEECNGLDDNCDGQIDERVPNPDAPKNCNGQVCAGLRPAMIQIPGLSKYMFQYEASRPDAETTDVDDSRACSKPGALPWTSVNRADAEAACAALRDSANNPMRLCTEEEWLAACGASNAWSYDSAPTVYASGSCNDYGLYNVDPALAKAWVTGFDNPSGSKNCRTSAGFFDLSGNVAEWTSKRETVLGKDYYRVYGGSFLTYGPATTCGSSVLDVPDFQNQDVGFRCCSDAAP